MPTVNWSQPGLSLHITTNPGPDRQHRWRDTGSTVVLIFKTESEVPGRLLHSLWLVVLYWQDQENNVRPSQKKTNFLLLLTLLCWTEVFPQIKTCAGDNHYKNIIQTPSYSLLFHIGLIQVKEDGWREFSKAWQGCSKWFPKGEAQGKSKGAALPAQVLTYRNNIGSLMFISCFKFSQ